MAEAIFARVLAWANLISSCRFTITPASSNTAGDCVLEYYQVIEIMDAIQLISKGSILFRNWLGMVARRHEAAFSELLANCGGTVEAHGKFGVFS